MSLMSEEAYDCPDCKNENWIEACDFKRLTDGVYRRIQTCIGCQHKFEILQVTRIQMVDEDELEESSEEEDELFEEQEDSPEEDGDEQK